MHIVSLELNNHPQIEYLLTNEHSVPFSHRLFASLTETLNDIVAYYKPIVGYTNYKKIDLYFNQKPSNFFEMCSYITARFNMYMTKNYNFWTVYDPKVNYFHLLNKFTFDLRYGEFNAFDVLVSSMKQSKDHINAIAEVSESTILIPDYVLFGVISKPKLFEVINKKQTVNNITELEVTEEIKGCLIIVCDDNIESLKSVIFDHEYLSNDIVSYNSYSMLKN